MKNFRKKVHSVPVISTASLPDIVFILLFFFMTVTTIKSEELLVENKLPQAHETEKLTKKDRVIEIFVGKLKEENPRQHKGNFAIQIESKLIKIDEIGHCALRQLAEMPTHLRKVAIVSLKADEEVNMGLINSIKEELRQVNLLKINYTVVEGNVF